MRIKLFENFENTSFIQNVKDCFYDLIDDGIAQILDKEDWESYDIVLDITLPANEVESASYHKFFDQSKEYFEKLNVVNDCIERLKIHNGESFDLEYDFGTNDDRTCSLVLMFKKETSEVGGFYKISPDGSVLLDKDGLRELLGIPKSTEFRRYSGSYGKFLAIYFKNQETLDDHKKKVIDIMCNLKINDKPFLTESEITGYRGGDVSKKRKYEIYSPRYEGDKQVNYISFHLNDEIKFAYN